MQILVGGSPYQSSILVRGFYPPTRCVSHKGKTFVVYHKVTVFFACGKHLGSLTAANWVSFDFNVSYSSTYIRIAQRQECPAELKAFLKSKSILITVPQSSIACCCTQCVLWTTICTPQCVRKPYWEPSMTAYYSASCLSRLVVISGTLL